MYILHVVVFLLLCTLGIYIHISLVYLSEIKPNLKKKIVRGRKKVQISFREPNIVPYLISGVFFFIKTETKVINIPDENNTALGNFLTNLTWKIKRGIHWSPILNYGLSPENNWCFTKSQDLPGKFERGEDKFYDLSTKSFMVNSTGLWQASCITIASVHKPRE